MIRKIFLDPTIQVLAIAGFMILLGGAFLGEYQDKEYAQKVKIEQFWDLKSRGLSKYDFVVIGDSRVYRGVDPEVISSLNPGLSGVNLGYSSGGFGPLLFDLAEEKLARNGARVILIGLTPHAFTRNAAENEHLRGFLSKPLSESFTSAYMGGLLLRFAPVNWKRMCTPGGEKTKSGPENYIEDYRRTGFVASDYRVRAPFSALASYEKTFSEYQADPEVERDFLLRIARWRAAGYRIVTFAVPVHPALRDLESRMSGFRWNWIRDQLKVMQIPVLEMEEGAFETYDGSHLTEDSAKRFSERLGNAVRSLLRAKPVEGPRTGKLFK